VTPEEGLWDDVDIRRGSGARCWTSWLRDARSPGLELANAVFDYLEIFHNRRRRHSALGWLTPIEFENRTSITVA